MATITRLSDSCLTVTTDEGTTLFDPGFFTWDHHNEALESLGEVQRVFISHEHFDHVKPEFVRWLVDRGDDVRVFSNQVVVDLLAAEGIDASIAVPEGALAEDVLHERVVSGATPPNRAWTIDGVLTHPGDSQGLSFTAPVLALPIMAPWTSMTAAFEFATRLGPRQVIPIHDFHTSSFGREMVAKLITQFLDQADIEMVPLDWGASYTV